ncbi:pentatricopeptide repeat-containing protein At5g66500, mitochondrial [Durio zibethinus]|uniref:Pentatricopeptide repeat-containing protein At5g66500, mitochondrial n=1 Tax=Durio zibethinus TaxID=66656 RepID=A0A6P5WY12_DURZI|nr:pentatricopeptide repeat-containing protein At5g66500, mitochondrial [Durio zibethinus]
MSVSHRCIRYLSYQTRNLQAIASIEVLLIKHQKRYAHIRRSLKELPLRDIYSFNGQLVSYFRNGDIQATWALFCHMHFSCCDLNAYTFTPVLSACSALPGTKHGKQVHGLMVKTGVDAGTVAKTALMNLYSKYGCLDDSARAFEEIELKDVVTWNALISSFLRHGLAKKALDVFATMRREKVPHSEFTLCSVLKACSSLKAFEQGKQIHGLVVVFGRDLVILGTALIDFYSDIERISEALKVFSSLNNMMDSVMCNSLIRGCIKNRKYKEAFSIMSKMRPNVVALTSALGACSENSDLWVGKQIHCVALRFGFTDDTQLCNVILDMYAKCGKILNARSLFDGILHKCVVSWTSMIDAYGSHGYGLEALELFKLMEVKGNGVMPNSVTFLAVLSACGHSGLVEEGQKCFNLMREKYGLDLHQEHYACFIDVLGRAGQIDEAWCLLDDMIKNGTRPTAVIWIALLNACSLNQDIARGELAAKHLLELEPDKPGNYVLLSNFYATIGRWDSVDNLRDIMRKKGLTKEAGSSRVTVKRHNDTGTIRDSRIARAFL